MKISEIEKTNFFPIAIKHILKRNKVAGLKIVTCTLKRKSAQVIRVPTDILVPLALITLPIKSAQMTALSTFGILMPFNKSAQWQVGRPFSRRRDTSEEKNKNNPFFLNEFSKLHFYNQNCDFWPLGLLLPFLKGPP